MNNDFLKWLTKQREISEEFYTVYEICKKINKHPTTQLYRKFNRMVAYGLLEYKYVPERHALVYRKIKEEKTK